MVLCRKSFSSSKKSPQIGYTKSDYFLILSKMMYTRKIKICWKYLSSLIGPCTRARTLKKKKFFKTISFNSMYEKNVYSLWALFFELWPLFSTKWRGMKWRENQPSPKKVPRQPSLLALLRSCATCDVLWLELASVTGKRVYRFFIILLPHAWCSPKAHRQEVVEYNIYREL